MLRRALAPVYVGGNNVKNDTQLGQGDTELFCEGGVGSSKLILRNKSGKRFKDLDTCDIMLNADVAGVFS